MERFFTVAMLVISIWAVAVGVNAIYQLSQIDMVAAVSK